MRLLGPSGRSFASKTLSEGLIHDIKIEALTETRHITFGGKQWQVVTLSNTISEVAAKDGAFDGAEIRTSSFFDTQWKLTSIVPQV